MKITGSLVSMIDVGCCSNVVFTSCCMANVGLGMVPI